MHELNIDDLSLSATLLVALILGLKHSLETDHLLAVATLVTRAKRKAKAA
jgi:high-affinity nickel permease